MHVLNIKTTKLQRTIMYAGATIWNYLSNEINTNCTITTLKHHLKKCLIVCRIHRVYVS